MDREVTEGRLPGSGPQARRFSRPQTHTKPHDPRQRDRAEFRWLERSPQAAALESGVREIREGQRRDEALRRDSLNRRALGVADMVAAAAAIGAALAIEGDRPRPLLLLALPVVVLFCKLARLYDRDESVLRKSTLDQIPALFATATIYALIVWLASGVLVDGGFGKPAIAALWLVLLAGFAVFRALARTIANRTLSPERVLVLGSASATNRLRRRIETAHSLSATIVGRVALNRGDGQLPSPIGELEDLDFVLRAHNVERVIIVATERPSEEMLDIIRVVKALGVKVSVLPRLFEVVGSSLELDDIDGITILGLRRYGLPKSSWYLKRTLDLVVAATTLVFLAPLLFLIALAIRVSSPGPILFRQPRVGRGGRVFNMLKFRTMGVGADDRKAELDAHNQASGLFKIPNDPRVTAVGRVLRRTSLDELPQLINVLRGEMSMVGPRPLVEEEEQRIAGGYYRRREATPGMTGVWQVLGPTRVSLDDMVKLDYLYRANWSLWLDIRILMRTVAHVLLRRGL